MTIDISNPGSARAALTAALVSLGVLEQVNVAVTSADFLSLATTPKEIIPAPGPNKIIQIVDFRVIYWFGTTPYSSLGSTFAGLYYDDFGDQNSGSINYMGDLFTQTESSITYGARSGNGAWYSFAHCENKRIVLRTPDDLIDGDGTAEVFASYRTISA